FVQLRNGHARISVTFAHAILAGMIFVVGMALNYYLVNIYKMDPRRLGPRMAWLQKNKIPLFALPLMLFLTGSRMPMACGVLCFLLLQIPKFRSMKTGAITMLLIIVVGGGVVYAGFQKYTTLKNGQDSTDEAQSSAIYRKLLLENYAPALEQGGFLGWGVESFPRFPGQVSVDNNYLILQLAHGNFGKWSFILLGVEAVFTLWIAAARFQSKETLYLVFSLMAGLIGIFVALSTVAMFEQVIQMTFLLLGWSQSLVDVRAYGVQTLQMPEPKFRFRRVIA
ncbi:MAG TPA: O-antigen ligase family protein, partial [Acidobacteriaceae bacterium]